MDSHDEGRKPRRWGFPLVLVWIGGVVILSVLDVCFLIGQRPASLGPPYPLSLFVTIAIICNFPFYGAAWGSLVLIAYIWLTHLSTLRKVCFTLILIAIGAVVVACLFSLWVIGHIH
jgi:hypothetical protein